MQIHALSKTFNHFCRPVCRAIRIQREPKQCLPLSYKLPYLWFREEKVLEKWIPACVLWFGSGWQRCFIWLTWYLKLFSDLVVNFQKLENFKYKSRFHASLGNLRALAALDLHLSMTKSYGAKSLLVPLYELLSGSPESHIAYLLWLLTTVAVWAQHSCWEGWNCSL